MGIPAEDIEAIKRSIDIVTVVRGSGVELEKHGNSYRGLCPFHPDTTPSFVVNPQRQLFHCFGCQAAGDVFNFLMKKYDLAFPASVDRARAMNGAGVHGADAPSHATPVRAIRAAEPGGTPSPTPGPVLQEWLRRTWAHYERTYKHSDRAASYLASRAISVVAQRGMEIGYCDGSLLRLVRGAAANKATLRELGILNDRGKEHLRGCAVFPLTAGDELANIYGRRVGSFGKVNVRHLVLPGKLGLYNAEQLEPGAELILCEGIIDAATLIAHGIANVLPLCGTTFTAAHRELVEHLKPAIVHVALDGDRAGMHAAEDIAGRLRESGQRVHLVELGEGVDINDFFAKLRYSADAFRALLKVAGPGLPGADLASESPVLALASPVLALASPENVESVRDLAAKNGTLPPPCQNAWQGGTSKTNGDSEHFARSVTDLVELAAFSTATIGPRNVLDEPTQGVGGGAEIAPAPIPVPPNREADAAPAPKPAAPTLLLERADDGFVARFTGQRIYRMRDVRPGQTRVKLQVSNNLGKHLDVLDLYSARARELFAQKAASRLGLNDANILEDELVEVLMALEERPKVQAAVRPEVTGDARRDALDLLRGPDLEQRIVRLLGSGGYIGEDTSKLVAFLGTVSRLQEDPFAVLVVSQSGAGKSALQDLICRCVPPEDLAQYTRLTGQALFYKDGGSLMHKVLSIEEEAGAAQAAYSIRNLQSAQVLRIAAARPDPQSGKMITDEYIVRGPVFIIITTTSPEAMDYETRNRFVILTIDESREQTQRVQDAQRWRETLGGIMARREFDHAQLLLQNAQRLLKPIEVVNNFAVKLGYPNDSIQMRRENKKYLQMIRSIGLLHQHQREVKHAEHDGEPFEYIEVTREDIILTNRLARQVLGRSIDELAPPSRNLLIELSKLRAERQRAGADRVIATRKEISDATRWNYSQLRRYLPQLIEQEYVAVIGGRNGQPFRYELVFDGDPEVDRYLPGLIDPDPDPEPQR